MQLTLFTDYSLRVLLYLVEHPGTRATVNDISAYYGVSYHHLVKVVHQLATLGYVDSTKGRGGGIRLARPAAAVVIGDVVRDLETSLFPVDCNGERVGNQRCVIARRCRLRGILGEAMARFLDVLDGTTLADLVGGRGAGVGST